MKTASQVIDAGRTVLRRVRSRSIGARGSSLSSAPTSTLLARLSAQREELMASIAIAQTESLPAR